MSVAAGATSGPEKPPAAAVPSPVLPSRPPSRRPSRRHRILRRLRPRPHGRPPRPSRDRSGSESRRHHAARACLEPQRPGTGARRGRGARRGDGDEEPGSRGVVAGGFGEGRCRRHAGRTIRGGRRQGDDGGRGGTRRRQDVRRPLSLGLQRLPRRRQGAGAEHRRSPAGHGREDRRRRARGARTSPSSRRRAASSPRRGPSRPETRSDARRRGPPARCEVAGRPPASPTPAALTQASAPSLGAASRSARRAPWARVRGSASIGYYQSTDNTGTGLGYNERTARLDLTASDIDGRPLSFTLRGRSRQDVRERRLSDRTPQSERTDRLYEVALRYEPAVRPLRRRGGAHRPLPVRRHRLPRRGARALRVMPQPATSAPSAGAPPRSRASASTARVRSTAPSSSWRRAAATRRPASTASSPSCARTRTATSAAST